MQIDAGSKVERIAELNDMLRTTFLGGKVLLTATVAALPMTKKAALFKAIKGFGAFTEDMQRPVFPPLHDGPGARAQGAVPVGSAGAVAR